MNPDQPNVPNRPQNDENIFLTKVAPPPTPEEKRRAALGITIGLIIGFAVLVVSVFMLLFIGANSAASSYNSSTTKQITTMMNTVKSINVDEILNQKDISASIKKVEQLQHDRPRLASVIFADSLSASYKSAEDSQKNANTFYQKVTTFTQQLPALLLFAQATDETHSDLIKLVENKTIKNASQAQTIAGSIDDLAARVKDLSVPEALEAPRNTLAADYTELAEGYRDLASSFTDSASSKAQAKRRIANAMRTIESDSDSSGYASRVKEHIIKLDGEAQALINSL